MGAKVKLHTHTFLNRHYGVSNFTPRPPYLAKEPRYSLNLRLGGPHRQQGRFRKKNNLLPPPAFEPVPPSLWHSRYGSDIRLPLVVTRRARAPASTSGICGEQSGTGTSSSEFSPVLFHQFPIRRTIFKRRTSGRIHITLMMGTRYLIQRDFRLTMRCKRGRRSSVMLLGVRLVVRYRCSGMSRSLEAGTNR